MLTKIPTSNVINQCTDVNFIYFLINFRILENKESKQKQIGFLLIDPFHLFLISNIFLFFQDFRIHCEIVKNARGVLHNLEKLEILSNDYFFNQTNDNAVMYNQ